MSAQKFKRGDYLLLLLYAYDQAKLEGRTRLQKIAFLFEKEVLKQYRFDREFDVTEMGDFKAFHYGPFSKKVFQFIDLFESLGLVEVSTEQNPESTLDLDIFIEDLLQEDDSEWREELGEIEREHVPVYGLTEKGKHYIEERLWRFLDTEKMQALDKLKENCVNTPLKLLIKYIYTRYPEFARESRIKEDILRETKWQF